MSKELDRAKNLTARRPIPPAIRQLLEPLAAAAPEDEKPDFDELYAIVDELLPLPEKTRSEKDARPLRTQQEQEEEKDDEQAQED